MQNHNYDLWLLGLVKSIPLKIRKQICEKWNVSKRLIHEDSRKEYERLMKYEK